jgi:TrpR-related protein YerC/YecD
MSDVSSTTIEDALLSLETKEELRSFLKDLLTPQEIKALNERWQIAWRLEQGQLSYREISAQTGASVTTITRVARFLKDEPYQGYRIALDRLKSVEGHHHHHQNES